MNPSWGSHLINAPCEFDLKKFELFEALNRRKLRKHFFWSLKHMHRSFSADHFNYCNLCDYNTTMEILMSMRHCF